MLLAKWKEKLSGAMKKLSGRKDFLEAVCAASALVAASDGEISDTELTTAIKVISSNPTLAAAFRSTEIEKTADTMLRRAQSGRTGRMGLFKEIDDIAGQGDLGETVYLCALDVAESSGGISPEEKKTLTEIARRVGVNEQAMQV